MPRPLSRALKRAILLLLLLVYMLPVEAQILSGTVRSIDNAPLPGANVLIVERSQGAVTDVEGAYSFVTLPPGIYTLRASFIGFETEERAITIGSEPVTENFRLTPSIVQSDEVVVTDNREDALTRDTRSVSVLEAEDLAELRGQTLGETLEEIAGVTALKTGPSISKPVVRGLHSQRVLVLNSGVSQEGQQWGGEHAPEIDPFAPVRIEVVKGVAGVEYGVGAIGGVIRLEPLDLPSVPGQGVNGQFSLNGFSNNMQGAGSVFLEGPANFLPGLGWRIQSSYRKAGDAEAPNYIISNSAFEEFNGSASIGLERDRLSVVAHLSHFGTELGIFSGAHIGNRDDLLRAIERGEPSFIGEFGYDIGPPKQKISHNLATIHGDYRLPGGGLIEAQYGYQHNHRQEFDAHRGSGSDPSFDLSLISHTFDLKYEHPPSDNFFGVIGLSGMNQLNRNDATGFLIPNFRAYTIGAFARESWTKHDWTLEAGVRYDYRWTRAWPRENLSSGEFVKRISDYASASGVLGAIWQFAPTWSVGVNLGTGWRPPSVNELYNFGVHHGTAQFEIGDPDLETERSVGLDATLRHESDRSRLEFSIYNNWFDRFIHLLPDPNPRVTIRGTFPTFRYTQSDALLRGFDASFEHDLSSWLALGWQASVVRGDDRELDEPLISMPSDRMMLRTSIYFPDLENMQGTHIDLESMLVRKQERFVAGLDYADPPDGYALFNVGLSTQLLTRSDNPVRVNVEVQNILDTTYRDYLSRFRYFIDDPGRSFILRIQVPLGGAANADVTG